MIFSSKEFSLRQLRAPIEFKWREHLADGGVTDTPKRLNHPFLFYFLLYFKLLRAYKRLVAQGSVYWEPLGLAEGVGGLCWSTGPWASRRGCCCAKGI